MLDKQTLLLDAATILLASKGYQGFSMKELAEHAGVAAGTIYNHFKNKEDLLQNLHTRNLRCLEQYMFNGLEKTEPVFDQFSLIWKNFWQYSMENRDAILAKPHFDNLPKEMQLEQELLAKSLFEYVFVLLQRGVEQKLLKPYPIDILAALSIEACANLARKHILGLIAVDDNMIDELVDACWNSIALK
jgi:TetR/AcrR family transcriptional repressor of multidrug resistance operon